MQRPGQPQPVEDIAVPVSITYICGQCGNDVELKPNDQVRCRECGYRILFKKRMHRPMQYEAR